MNKRTSISLFSLLIFFISYAQEMSVLNIPLKGTIDTFTSKIQSQGYRISPESKNLPIGQRMFEVRVAGEEVLMLVSYFPETKRVYDAILIFSSFNENDLTKYFNWYKSQLPKKFQNQNVSVFKEEDIFHKKPMWRFHYSGPNSNLIGKAYIYYWDIPADDEFDTIYQLNIRYRNDEAPNFLDEYQDYF